jgi:hypothetical protein
MVTTVTVAMPTVVRNGALAADTTVGSLAVMVATVGADTAQQPVAADMAQQPVAADTAQQPVAADMAQQPVAADMAQQPVAAAKNITKR